jgi:hypothetical protein
MNPGDVSIQNTDEKRLKDEKTAVSETVLLA